MHHMAATAPLEQFDLVNPLSFLRESLEPEEKSSHFDLSGARRIIGSTMMSAGMQLSAICA